MVSSATERKASYEEETCKRTFLLLTNPYPLSLVRQQVVAAVRANRPTTAFREIWLGGLDEAPFPVCP